MQIIAFLAGLHHSGLYRPTLIVCPATVLRQWLRELRAWWPLARVALLHDSARSGAAGGARPTRQRLIRDIGRVRGLGVWVGGLSWQHQLVQRLPTSVLSAHQRSLLLFLLLHATPAASRLQHLPPCTPPLGPQSESGVLVTTYETMRLQRAELLSVAWGYVVLDEGHKIRCERAGAAAAAAASQLSLPSCRCTHAVLWQPSWASQAGC